MVEQTVDQNSALKAAKKLLKKEESKSLKVKVLAKNIVEKLGAGNVKTIKKWIVASDKFAVNGKVVTLASKKRLSEAQLETSSKKLKTMDTENKSPVISTMNESTVSEWRKKHKIVVMDARDTEEGKEATKELNTKAEYFPDASFDMVSRENEIAPVLLKHCTEGNGFKSPSPIQAQCWPVLLHTLNGKKRDVVGIAETGSGKTLAFGLPALSAMSFEGTSKRRLPRMLVLAPTRELAMQSHEVLAEFGALVDLNSLVIYGGVPKYTQTAELRKKSVDCIVATPGRIKDLINDGSCDLSHVSHLVLDEADRMLDMGFEEDVRYIISQCKAKEDGRQTAMFSATWPAAIQQIAMEYMIDPVRIYVGFEAIVGSNGENSIDDSLSANKRVSQTVEVIEDRARESRLRALLNQYHGKRNNRVLVFALYKKEAERLEHQLRRDGWNCCSIHGNKNQDARTQALSQFKDGSCPLLIATDVAARGLDIPNVEVVLNFTFPLTIEDYVHRIGRTGRAGKTGISHTFFQPGDKSHAG
jgi:ATP-dependent RNA helicase DBP3